PAFLIENGLINLAAGEIVDASQIRVGKAFVMAEVEIGLCAVIEDINLAVLIRAHRARIDVKVGIEFLESDFEAAILEQRPERGGGESFAQRADHAAGYKNILHFLSRKIRSTRCTSEGTSTPMLSYSTCATLILTPLSSAR